MARFPCLNPQRGGEAGKGQRKPKAAGKAPTIKGPELAAQKPGEDKKKHQSPNRYVKAQEVTAANTRVTPAQDPKKPIQRAKHHQREDAIYPAPVFEVAAVARSEERRVGKECRS